jgi:acyl carrier protein
MAEPVLDRVRRVAADVFGVPVDSVRATSSVEDIETWDSFNVVHLVMALEAEFGISLTADEAAELASIPAIVAVLAARGIHA